MISQLPLFGILTAVGWARVERPYYLCPACHSGQFPADVELDIHKTDLSPAVRRMLGVVGGEAAFSQGRDQMKLLAGLEVTAKAPWRCCLLNGELGDYWSTPSCCFL